MGATPVSRKSNGRGKPIRLNERQQAMAAEYVTRMHVAGIPSKYIIGHLGYDEAIGYAQYAACNAAARFIERANTDVKSVAFTQYANHRVRWALLTAVRYHWADKDNQAKTFYSQESETQSKHVGTECVIDNADEVQNLMECLSESESDVIRRSFGIGCTPMIYPEIAAEIGITEAKVFEIRGRAMSKMRANAGAK